MQLNLYLFLLNYMNNDLKNNFFWKLIIYEFIMNSRKIQFIIIINRSEFPAAPPVIPW